MRSRVASLVGLACGAILSGCTSEPPYNTATEADAAAVAKTGPAATARRPTSAASKRPPKPTPVGQPAANHVGSPLND